MYKYLVYVLLNFDFSHTTTRILSPSTSIDCEIYKLVSTSKLSHLFISLYLISISVADILIT
jgi:hypothetical protein